MQDDGEDDSELDDDDDDDDDGERDSDEDDYDEDDEYQEEEEEPDIPDEDKTPVRLALASWKCAQHLVPPLLVVLFVAVGSYAAVDAQGVVRCRWIFRSCCR